MYILIYSKNNETINKLKNILLRMFDEQTSLIARSEIEAREIIKEKQISLAFIQIGDLKEIELAKRIIKKNPVVNIVFIADNEKYAHKAFEIFASGYIIKPITEKIIKDNLEHLRFQLNHSNNNKKVEVHCFGKFDVFVDGKPVKFLRSKSKELLAYLVDRKGTMCNSNDLLAILWEDKEPTKSLKQQLRNIISDLNKSLRQVGIENIIIRENNEIGIDKYKIKCDLYDFWKGDPKALHSFNGEYMSQYSNWSYTMELNLQKYFYEE